MARGIVLESETLKVLKALAELEGVIASELLERILLHTFDDE